MIDFIVEDNEALTYVLEITTPAYNTVVDDTDIEIEVRSTTSNLEVETAVTYLELSSVGLQGAKGEKGDPGDVGEPDLTDMTLIFENGLA